MPYSRQDLRDDIRTRIGELIPHDIPDPILNIWLNQGMYDVAIRLSGISDIWTGDIASTTYGKSAAHYDADSISTGSADAYKITGFNNLTPDEWIGGSLVLLKEDKGKLIIDTILDNDASTVTIAGNVQLNTSETQLLALLIKDGRGLGFGYSARAINDRAMQVNKTVDSTDEDTAGRLPFVPVSDFENIKTLMGYDSEVQCAQFGNIIFLSKGPSGTYPASPENIATWHVKRPRPMEADTDELTTYDERLPEEFVDLVISSVIIKALAIKGESIGEAEQQLAGKYDEIRESLAQEIAIMSESDIRSEDIR